MDKNPFNIDDLKSLWQSQSEQEAAQDLSFNNHKILNIMQEKTNAAVQRIRKNLLIEVVLTIPLMIGMYFLFQAKDIRLPSIFWIGLTVLTFGYHVYLLWKLPKNELNTTSISETINHQYRRIKGLIRIYNLMAIVGGLVFFAASGLVFYNQYQNSTVMLPVLLIISLSSGYGFYAFVRWYNQKVYGQYLTVLEASKQVLEQA
jgi:cation transport ATPase